MRGPLYVVAQNVCLGMLDTLHLLKFGFSGGLDDLRTGYGSRIRRLAPFYVWQVDSPALGKSAPLRSPKPKLRFR